MKQEVIHLSTVILLLVALSTTVGPCSGDSRQTILVQTLQQDFYDENTGLWKPPTYWWNSANALECLIEYMLYTKDTSYLNTIENTFQHTNLSETKNGYYDDAQWWAIAWIRAYQLTGEQKYKERSVDIWNYILQAWDDHCGGGVWWDESKNYKNAITNELFFSLSMLLYQYDNQNATYLEWAKKEWAWFEGTGMINSNSLINDGLDAKCKNNGQTTWTYNQGVILGGLTYLARVTNNNTLLGLAQKIVDSVMVNLVYPEGILREPCEINGGTCGTDGPQFKGIFTRYLGIFAHDLPSDNPERTKYIAWLQKNTDSIWNNDRTEQNTCGFRWVGPPQQLIGTTQTSALDCFNALYLLTNQ